MVHTRSASGISLHAARVGSASVVVSVLEGAERGMVIRAVRMSGLVRPGRRPRLRYRAHEVLAISFASSHAHPSDVYVPWVWQDLRHQKGAFEFGFFDWKWR